MYRLFATIVVVGTLLVAMPARAAPPFAALELRLGDLPAGFTASSDYDMTLAQLAAGDHMSRAAEARTGVLGGHERDFGSKATSGLFAIFSTIIVYASGGHAGAAFATLLARKTPASLRRVSARGLGAAAVAYRGAINIPANAATHKPAPAATFYAFFFRRGIYLVGVTLFGVAHTYTLTQALVYPKIVDARIKAAMEHVPGAPPR